MADRRRDEELKALVREVAQTAFGFDSLRPGQEEASAAVLAGRDVLAVMPTGAGKSAIYQLAGALVGGSTVVVSPLIALQHDQIEGIGGRLGGAAPINSTMTARRRSAVLERARRGELEFVFVAPEQLANQDTVDALRAAAPSLFVVDEAHCISAWGHDFRPDYLRLGPAIEALGRPQVIALTATAAPPVRREIVAALGLEDPVVVVSGFDRPNIFLGVETFPDEDAAHRSLVARARDLPGTGIVYVSTRAQAEGLAAELCTPAREARPYHAGLPAGERAAVHERFLQPGPFLVVATTAFGMGIDAPHVRFVLHADPPESLDAYYQELGRAGRDGDPAQAIVFRSRDAAGGRRFLAGAAELPEPVLAAVAQVVAAAGTTGEDDVAATLKAPPGQLRRAADLLAAAGALTIEAGSRITWTGRTDARTAVAAASEAHEAYRAFERTRGEMMGRYLDTGGCRWQAVLGYFGQPGDEPCGHCDNCRADDGTAGRRGERPFPLEARVAHGRWGEGQVVGYDGDTMTVLFDGAGYRALSVPLVVQNGLLAGVGETPPGDAGGP